MSSESRAPRSAAPVVKEPDTAPQGQQAQQSVAHMLREPEQAGPSAREHQRHPSTPGSHGTFYHLCAGEARAGEFSEVVRELGERARDVDTCRDSAHDLTDDEFVDGICDEAREGLVAFALIGVPCETHSPGRRRILRPIDEPEGALEGMTDVERHQVDVVNTIIENTARFALVLHRASGGFIFEHPTFRQIKGTPFYWPAKAGRASLQQMPCIITLKQATGAVWIYAPHCYFGAEAQKWSMYLVSPEALPFFPALIDARCDHESHAEHAYGRDGFGHGRAKGFAAYTTQLADCLARGAVAFANSRSGEARFPEPPQPLGEVSFGPKFHPVVREAISAAVNAPLRFASFQRLRAVPVDQRGAVAMPPEADSQPPAPPVDRGWYDSRATDSEGSDDETLASAPTGWQRPRRGKHRIPGVVALRIAYWMIWLPDPSTGRRTGIDIIFTWRDQAVKAQAQLRNKQKPEPPESVTVGPELKHPHFRLKLLDCRNPEDCVVVRRSTRATVHPGKHVCPHAMAKMAEEVGWMAIDPDMVRQLTGPGIESRSERPFVTALGFHHTGVLTGFDEVDAIIMADSSNGRLGGPYTFCPPFEPFVNLPRNMVFQQKLKQTDAGGFIEVPKARVTTNGSYSIPYEAPGEEWDDTSPNAGIPAEERSMSMPTALRHGHAAAVIDSAGDGQGIRGATYSTDRSNAFSAMLNTRVEWYLAGFFWDMPLGSSWQGGNSSDATAERARQHRAGAGGHGWLPPLCPTARVGGFMCSFRCYFGGSHMPQSFQRTGRMVRAVSRKRQREFDEAHPFPACVQQWQQKRRVLQSAGLLPPGDEQCEPSDLQTFIDDHGGSALNDITGIPSSLECIKLDLSIMEASGGVPAPLDSRVANHCRIDLAVALEAGFDISAKTQCGDRVVSLGLRICIIEDRLDCPPLKAAGMRAACVQLAQSIETGVDRAATERQVGRAGNLAQIFPSLLPHLHAGYAVACAGARSWRAPKLVYLSKQRHTARQFRVFLAELDAVLERNAGLPLVHQQPFTEGDILVVATDASREGGMTGEPTPHESADDGVGGFAFDPEDAEHVILVSEKWPPRIREAMAVSAARRVARGALPALRFPMPAGELFGGWAVAEAVQDMLGKRFDAVIAVGDCKPAASALTLGKSRSSTMRPLLRAMPLESQRYLGVWVPREFNTTGDRLSHPSLLWELRLALTEAGIRSSVARIPGVCWDVAEGAIEAHA